LGQVDDFLGHLTLTEFVIISRSARIGEVIDVLRKRLEQSFEYFYRHQDRDAAIFGGMDWQSQLRKCRPVTSCHPTWLSSSVTLSNSIIRGQIESYICNANL
jgi:hypothetical protein